MRGRQIAMIFQDPMTSLNPTLTIGLQLTETMQRHLDISRDEARKRAVELLEEVHIPNARQRLDDYPHRYSGGMRQRVMIAIALSCSPKLLIADEPTTALDVTVQAGILDLLEELRDEHEMSMIIITHDMGVVAEAADDIAVMYAGQIVEQASAEELFDHPGASVHRGAARCAAAARGRGRARGPAHRDSRAARRICSTRRRRAASRRAARTPARRLVHGEAAAAARDPPRPSRAQRASRERARGSAPVGAPA